METTFSKLGLLRDLLGDKKIYGIVIGTGPPDKEKRCCISFGEVCNG